jgi:chromosome segregation protein
MFRLEKLEISGFKSFPDRTSLVFGEGITAIVGPNGCGKSNLSEAISWVLGEQSAKSLRGGKMEDVIFNGTRDRKPTGLAEVLLTLVAVEDIAERDSETDTEEDESRFDEAVENAARAADTARSLVEEMTRSESAEQAAQVSANADQPQASADGQQATPAADQENPVNVADNAEASITQSDGVIAPLEVNAEPQQKPKERKRSSMPRKRKKVAISAGERITIGRRLYRTGDSDYLMNGRQCLLRDIQDLFAGTGLGGAHYAIIEQGRIGQILSSKPLDRRALIEEAAGITKFKSRKRSAELKLESAKQNLTRLNDIISEVERQVNSLKRQAQKARRYRRLKDEMRGLQKMVFTADYYRLNESAQRVTDELGEAAVKQTELGSALAERESEYRAASGQARAVEDNLTGLREQASVIDLEADRARNRRAFDEQQSAELLARIEELTRDQKALEERLSLLDEESTRRRADLQSLEKELMSEQADLLEREREYQGELARLREAEAGIEQLRQRMLVEIGQLERLRNLSANLEDALRKLDLKQNSLSAELERAQARLEEELTEYERVADEAEGNRARLAELSASIAERAHALDSLRNHNIELRSQLEVVHTERTASEHRLASLEDLDAHHAYYSDAVQFVLSPEQSERINALGTLADFVEVEAQFERLVESLFLRELQCVMVPTIDDALAGVESLKTEKLGRGAFLVVGLHGAEGEPDEEIEKQTESAISSSENMPVQDAQELAGNDQTAEINDEYISIDDDPIDDPINGNIAFGGYLSEFMYTEQWPASNEEERASYNEPQSLNASMDEEARQPLFQLDVLCAVDLLGLRPEIKTVAERAFPEKCAAAVVPDMEAALQLSIENPSRVYITMDGEQVVNGRLIVTGAQTEQKSTSLLGLKREIKQLRTQTAVLRDEEQRIAAELANAQKQLEEIESESIALDRELRQQEKTAAARDSQLEGLARDLERARQHVRVVESELQQSGEERAELESRISQLAVELQSAEASQQEAQQLLASAQADFAEMRARVEQFAEQLSSTRASVAARAERLQAARSELRRTDNESEELGSRINRNRIELYESHTRVEQLRSSQAEVDTAAARFEEERTKLSEQIDELSQSLSSARARADELESMLTLLRQESTAAHDRRGHLEVEYARLESEAGHLARTCFAELAMSIEDVVTSYELGSGQWPVVSGQSASGNGDDLSDATSEKVEAAIEIGAEQLAADHWSLTTAIEEARTRLDELRVKLEEMGAVNMMALEELEESEERFRFLSEQRRDILDSISMTEEALTEIKRRSRERFRHAFAEINQNFQRMFVELFGGGRGEMILIDEDDVLESGIDLIAQPPGKRLQNVLLLSGGEKAMAAISLVLAIFQYRPSPFCILDEVDAPLDEMNVGRFSNKIIEMSQETQFLVITHNKRTMESARALYGVTMEEPGISKLVSVKFE